MNTKTQFAFDDHSEVKKNLHFVEDRAFFG